MSSNRYGQIWHGDHHHINIRFPSNEARLKFQEEFETYHNSHDHDGEAPVFKLVTSADLKLSTGSRTPEDLVKAETDDAYRITIDGYPAYEIESYQDNQDLSDYNWYRPPTCCVPPVIVIDRKFVDSADLERQALSAVFGDMPESDFQSLITSIETDGIVDPVIRIYEGQILDGWHRYRAAQELGILRKLRFREWHEDDHRDGDPKAFVLARNIERRHLNASQRAQIAVTFNERFGHGGDRSKGSNEPLKTQEELATEANVSKSSIKRAVQVEKAGQSEQVIAGEKSASQVITEETVKDLWAKVSEEIPKWKAREKEKCKYPSDSIGHASKSMLIEALRQYDIENDTEGPATVEELKQLLSLMQTDDFPFVVAVRDVLKGRQKPVQETEQPSQTAEEREANKLRKQKKQLLKSIWDKRKQASRDWLGTEDNDLTTYTDLDALEKAFVAYEEHAYCADAFQSGMRRTAEQTFNICLEKTLSSDVSLEALEAESKAISTYALDILQWEKQEWIQQLIDKKRKKAKTAETPAEPETPEEDSPDREAFNLALNNAQNRLAWMWDSFENMDYLTGVSRETFAVEAAKTLNCYEEGQYSSGENYLLEKDYALLKNLTISELKGWTKRFDKIQDAIHKKSDWITSLVPAEADNAPEPDMDALWDAFNKRFPKWKAKYAESGYKENSLIQGATEAELFDALRVYRDSDRTGPVTAEEIKDVTDLMKRQSYPYAKRVRDVLRERKSDEGLSEIDRCYAQNQLCVLQNTISPLLRRLGADDMPRHGKEILTADLQDVFLQYEEVPTEKEMIVALLDLAHCILFEEIPND